MPVSGGTANAIAWSPDLSLLAAAGFYSSGLGVFTSTDANCWSPQVYPSPDWDGAGWSAIWSEEQAQFVVGCAGSLKQIMTSPDGITWTAQTTPFDGDGLLGVLTFGEIYDLAFIPTSEGGPLYIAVGDWMAATGYALPMYTMMTSPDGVTWTAVPTDFDSTNSPQYPNRIETVSWSPSLGLSVLAGWSYDTGLSVETYSGGVLTPQTSPLDGNTQAIISSAWSESLGIFLVVGIDPTTPGMTSPDGVTWTGYSTSPWTTEGTYVRSMEWFDALGLFVAGTNQITGSGTTIAYSSDGVSWTAATNPIAAGTGTGPISMVWTGTEIVAMCEGGTLTSPDGINWTQTTCASGGLHIHALV